MVYLTDGRLGRPSGTYSESDLPKQGQEEVATACNELSIEDLIFLRTHDQVVRACEGIVKELVAILRQRRPQRAISPVSLRGSLTQIN